MACKHDVLAIDGTTYEGGGGLIRDALSYSALLNKPLKVHSIRANRPGVGGLRPEHTVAISTMADLTSAEVAGNMPASRNVTFTPHVQSKTSNGKIASELDITVEGSGPIFLIAMLPYILFSHLAAGGHHFHSRLDGNDEIELKIRAGTLCVKAPSIFYMQQVFVPTMRLIGIREENFKIDHDYEQGWHTDTNKCPGKMVARIRPLSTPLPGFLLERRGRVRAIRVTAHAPKDALAQFKDVLKREMADIITDVENGVDLVIDTFPSVPDDQYHLLMVATTVEPPAYLGYEQVYPQSDVFTEDAKGNKEKIAIQLIRSCIHGLWTELRRGNGVDEHMEDAMVIYQTLAVGFSSVSSHENEDPVPELKADNPAIQPGSKYELDVGSLHQETSWWVAEQLADIHRETVRMNERDYSGCQGIGLGK